MVILTMGSTTAMFAGIFCLHSYPKYLYDIYSVVLVVKCNFIGNAFTDFTVHRTCVVTGLNRKPTLPKMTYGNPRWAFPRSGRILFHCLACLPQSQNTPEAICQHSDKSETGKNEKARMSCHSN